MNFLLLMYVVLMPFMSALAPSEWMPLPLFFMCFISPILLMRRAGLSFSIALQSDIGFIFMLALGLMAIPFSPLPLGSKNFNYSLALIICYLFLFIFVRLLLFQPQVQWANLSKVSHISLTILSFAIIGEFYAASFYGVFYSDIIPFAHENLNIANLLNDEFKRPRAFSVEPGFTALAYECLWPLTLLNYKKNRLEILRHGLYAVAFLLLASAAAIVCLLVAVIVVWAINFRSLRGLINITGSLVLVLLPFLVDSNGQDLLWSILGRKLDIVSLSVSEGSDGVTALDRLLTYELGLSLITEFPGGVGWGGIGQAFSQGLSLPINAVLRGSGMLSLYLDIAVASGLLGLLAFLYFIGTRMIKILLCSEPKAVFVSCALLSVCLHHVFITEFQYPYLWFLIALSDKILYESKIFRNSN